MGVLFVRRVLDEIHVLDVAVAEDRRRQGVGRRLLTAALTDEDRTRDVGRAMRMARAIQAGSVWINTYNGFDSASPFGGYKHSGWGREMGKHALEHYTQVKSVWVAY